MRIKRFIILSLIIILVFPHKCMASDTYNIQALIDEFEDGTGCKSVSVVIYDHGNISYYGDKDGLYQIGSMTKSFTGLAAVKLINEGKLSEDDKVSDYISGFEVFFESQKVDITVGQLLSQTSGFTNSEKDYPSAAEEMTLQDWAMTMSGKELKSAPGTEYNYSNVNYNLLGAIIENVSGMTYREYMEKEILDPIGMKRTFVGYPDASGVQVIEGARLAYRRAVDYEISVKEGRIPAGYFYSNTEDMAKWMSAWMNTDDISEEFRGPSEYIIGSLAKQGGYFAGWERFSDDVIGHSGGTPNYSSRIVISKKDGIAVCVLTNLNVAASTDSLCNTLYAVVSGKEAGPITKDVWTVFDIVFSLISVILIGLFIVLLNVKNRKILLGIGVLLIILLVLVLSVFPAIFGAALTEILLVWAPWSMTGSLILLMVNILLIIIKQVLGGAKLTLSSAARLRTVPTEK